jgi:hypothetical protein
MPLPEDEQTVDRRSNRGGAIPTTPDGPRPGGGSGSSSSGSGSSGSSTGGGGSTGTSSASASASSSSSTEAGYRRKAGNRYVQQADNLLAQARSLRRALNKSYGNALQQKLQNVNEILKVQDATLMEGYRERVKSLGGALDDNEKAAASQSSAAGGTMLRERANALSEIAMQGAGESDAMAAQMISLRNWSANQTEVERAKFDTLRSINSGLSDLNVDTKAGRINLQAQGLADKEQLWTNYYNQRSETLTQLGNVLGQRADYLEMAKEYGVGKGGNMKEASQAFMQAANVQGQAWDSPGISKKLKQWSGRGEFEPDRGGSSKLSAAPTVDLGSKPEGATLRKW